MNGCWCWGLCSARSIYHCHATAMPDSCLPSVQSAVAGENDEFSGKNQEVALQCIDLIPSGPHLYLILLDFTLKPIHFMKVYQPSQIGSAEPGSTECNFSSTCHQLISSVRSHLSFSLNLSQYPKARGEFFSFPCSQSEVGGGRALSRALCS